MLPKKRIALVAHDNKKQDLLEWAAFNRGLLARHELYATATSGRLLRDELGLNVVLLQSGPLGGDQQIGGKVCQGEIDFLIFFWDPVLRQNSVRRQVVDLSALIRRQSQLDDHPPVVRQNSIRWVGKWLIDQLLSRRGQEIRVSSGRRSLCLQEVDPRDNSTALPSDSFPYTLTCLPTAAERDAGPRPRGCSAARSNSSSSRRSSGRVAVTMACSGA
jgi:methylglyoxal synthase